MNRSGATPLTMLLTGESSDPAVLGGKGAALDRMIGWDLPVPPTGVVTAHAYRAIAALPGPADLVARLATCRDDDRHARAREVDEVFHDTRPPPDLRDQAIELARRVGAGRRVAVRSSATVEDLAHSSFAGLYRSVLDVDPDDGDAVVAALMSVFASLWHPEARAYRHALGIDETDVAMGAVVMQMVPAVRAGVTFTVDPGDAAGRARVEAVDGLAESLVSGARTPDAWLLDADEHPEAPREVRAALETARRIEGLAGCPQDVEWAWDGARLWVVQARPITTTADDGDGFDSPLTGADLTTAGIGEMLPGVLPALVWEVGAHLVEEAFSSVLDGLGLPLDEATGTGELLRRVRGRAALDFSRLRRMATLLPGGAADELERQYFGSRRTGRPATPEQPTGSRIAAARHDLRVLVQQHRAIQNAETISVAVAAIARHDADLATLDDDELLRYRYRLVDLGVRAMTAELACAAAAAASYRRLEQRLARHVGDVEAGRLAGATTTRPDTVAVPDGRASAAVFAGPTWDEIGRQPPTLPTRDRTDAPTEELRRRLFGTGDDEGSPLSWFRWRRIQRNIDDAVDHLGRREHTKAAVLELGGEVRRVHLELGRRLADAGTLERPTDVDLLTWDELAGALVGTAPPLGVVRRRRRWIRRYEGEGPLPVRFTGRPERSAVTLPPGERLEGWGASSGRCTARATFLSRPDGHLPDGQILLAEATDASWSPLFPTAGAIVLERGGPLSHAAILARELAVPAVLNVGVGVRALDGCELTVDGDSGVVVVHRSDGDAGPVRDGPAAGQGAPT